MHRQIGHERQRAHEHRSSFLQKRCAQRRRLSLDYMQTRFGQRKAHDFKFFRPARFRQRQRLRFRVASQQRFTARIAFAFRTLAKIGVIRLIVVHRLIALLHAQRARIPTNHLLIARHAQLANRGRFTAARTRLKIAHRNRQCRVSLTLQNTEATRKFHEWRIRGGTQRDWLRECQWGAGAVFF